MRRLLEQEGLRDRVEVDSAGTGDWHVGGPADPRAVRAMRHHGYDGSAHRARLFEPAWLAARDLVVALDRGHLRELTRLADRHGNGHADVRLLRSFDPTAAPDSDVPDPYYGSDADYAESFAQVERACRGLLAEVKAVLGRPAH